MKIIQDVLPIEMEFEVLGTIRDGFIWRIIQPSGPFFAIVLCESGGGFNTEEGAKKAAVKMLAALRGAEIVEEDDLG